MASHGVGKGGEVGHVGPDNGDSRVIFVMPYVPGASRREVVVERDRLGFRACGEAIGEMAADESRPAHNEYPTQHGLLLCHHLIDSHFVGCIARAG